MQYKDKILIVEKKPNCAYKENFFVVSIVINFLRTRYIFFLSSMKQFPVKPFLSPPARPTRPIAQPRQGFVPRGQ